MHVVLQARKWYADGHGPAYTPGIRLEQWPDDKSEAWQDLYERATVAPVRDVEIVHKL